MRPAKNRERILKASLELFNQCGVVAITTNHVSSHLGISPGNLYFHFANKEEIIRELFDQMCRETYEVWRGQKGNEPERGPVDLLEKLYEVFWDYRFFHREMYHLRRKDPILARKWRAHLTKTMSQLRSAYQRWVKAGVMKQIDSAAEMRMISDVVLITSSAFLNFFESPERPASRKSLRDGIQHVAYVLKPYHEPRFQSQLAPYLG